MSVGVYELSIGSESTDSTVYALVEFRDGKVETMHLSGEATGDKEFIDDVQRQLYSVVVEGKTASEDIEEALRKSGIVKQVRRVACFRAVFKGELGGGS